MNEEKFTILVSCNAPSLYPCEIFFGVLYCSEDVYISLPRLSPAKGEWGKVLTIQFLLEDEYPMPRFLDLVYLSIVERKFYSVEYELPHSEMERLWREQAQKGKDAAFGHIVVGMAPYGKVAVWFSGMKKEVLVDWIEAEEIEVEMAEFMPHDPVLTLDEVCDSYINNESSVKINLVNNGLPPRQLFNKYMQQFMYRYLPIFDKWNDEKKEWNTAEESNSAIEADYIEESLFDGTYDKLRDGGLTRYHQAGKPRRLALSWHEGRSEFAAYFWFDDERLCAVFDKFYGAHRDTRTDFIIRVDAAARKYELALFRYGLKEPVVIPEEAYQLLVFKNRFEDFRSPNYDQPRGAWIW